jgi:Protein of unknown function (DUF2934)
MISILFIGVGTALAVFAILAKTYAGGRKKAEKWEKGEIIKQLLALSERENRVSAIASPPARNLRLASTRSTRGATLRKGTLWQHKPKRRRSHMSPTPRSPLRPNQTDAEIEEEIRQRAYGLYQKRAGVEGNATDDWLQAKKEVLSHKAKQPTRNPGMRGTISDI